MERDKTHKSNVTVGEFDCLGLSKSEFCSMADANRKFNSNLAFPCQERGFSKNWGLMGVAGEGIRRLPPFFNLMDESWK